MTIPARLLRRCEHLDDSDGVMVSVGDVRGLVGELEVAKSVLKPFDDMAGEVFARNKNSDDLILVFSDPNGVVHTLTGEDFFAARAFLSRNKDDDDDETN